MIGIYKITNKSNGKSYIGQSKDIERRWKQHKNPTTWKNNPSMIIYKALKDFGIENFRFSILEECDLKDLDNAEKKWIKIYNSLYPNGYNKQEGGKIVPPFPFKNKKRNRK